MKYLNDDTLRVYVASSHDNVAHARALAERLREIGCEIVSKWTERSTGWSIDIERNVVRARFDVDELRQANIFVGLITDMSRTSHAEFGFAMAAGMPCFVVSLHGDHWNLLMYHPDVHRLPSENSLVERLFMLVKAKIVACDVCGRDMARTMRDGESLLTCSCGASRIASPMAWKNELIKGHQAVCSNVAEDKGDFVFCSVCQAEWHRRDDGSIERVMV